MQTCRAVGPDCCVSPVGSTSGWWCGLVVRWLDVEVRAETGHLEQASYVTTGRQEDQFSPQGLCPLVRRDERRQTGRVQELQLGQVDCDVPHALPRQIGQLRIQLRDVGRIELAREQHKGVLRFSLASFGLQDAVTRYTKRQRNTNSAFLSDRHMGDCLV